MHQQMINPKAAYCANVAMGSCFEWNLTVDVTHLWSDGDVSFVVFIGHSFELKRLLAQKQIFFSVAASVQPIAYSSCPLANT
jgi:hypothetical protein